MKKLSLLSLLGLTGMLAFIATPIYAQNLADEIVDGAENLADEIVDGTENVVNDAEDAINNEIDSYNLDYDFSNTWDMSDYNTDSYYLGSEGLNTGTMALLLGLGFGAVVCMILGFILRCLYILSHGEVFKKAGKKLWAFLVPFWGTMVYSKIAGINKWTGLLPWLSAIVPLFGLTGGTNINGAIRIITLILAIATLIWWIVVNYRVARRYGWGKFASILHIIFYPITILVLGLGNYKYQGAVKKEAETVLEA